MQENEETLKFLSVYTHKNKKNWNKCLNNHCFPKNLACLIPPTQRNQERQRERWETANVY